MRIFFYGWRRKVGCATLVVACMLMGAWARSLHIADAVVVAFGRVSFEVQSERGILELMLHRISGRTYGCFGVEKTSWNSKDLAPIIFDENGVGYCEEIEDTYFDWRYERKAEFCGFVFARGEISDSIPLGIGVETKLIGFPYWVPTGLLTLLSAYLILWKRHQVTKTLAPSCTG